jgi:hypothetical protein
VLLPRDARPQRGASAPAAPPSPRTEVPTPHAQPASPCPACSPARPTHRTSWQHPATRTPLCTPRAPSPLPARQASRMPRAMPCHAVPCQTHRATLSKASRMPRAPQQQQPMQVPAHQPRPPHVSRARQSAICAPQGRRKQRVTGLKPQDCTPWASRVPAPRQHANRVPVRVVVPRRSPLQQCFRRCSPPPRSPAHRPRDHTPPPAAGPLAPRSSRPGSGGPVFL